MAASAVSDPMGAMAEAMVVAVTVKAVTAMAVAVVMSVVTKLHSFDVIYGGSSFTITSVITRDCLPSVFFICVVTLRPGNNRAFV